MHVDAVAAAFLLALDSPDASGVFHVASDEEPTWRQIAEAIAINAGVTTQDLSVEEVAKLLDPFTAMFMTTRNRLNAGHIRSQLGWSHAGYVPLLWDLAAGSYSLHNEL